MHVKRTKELDDNHLSKNDRKDPKVIAKLVTEGILQLKGESLNSAIQPIKNRYFVIEKSNLQKKLHTPSFLFIVPSTYKSNNFSRLFFSLSSLNFSLRTYCFITLIVNLNKVIYIFFNIFCNIFKIFRNHSVKLVFHNGY